jgi:hypothetical protein
MNARTKITPIEQWPSDKYFLLIYFVHSYLESVKKDLVYDKSTTVENFRDHEPNNAHCLLIGKHSLTQWNYELSWNQVAQGISLFLRCQ